MHYAIYHSQSAMTFSRKNHYVHERKVRTKAMTNEKKLSCFLQEKKMENSILYAISMKKSVAKNNKQQSL